MSGDAPAWTISRQFVELVTKTSMYRFDGAMMRHTPVEFTIQGVLPISANRALRMHWAKRRENADDFGKLMLANISKLEIKCLKAWKELELRVSVKMEITNPRWIDQDNLYAFAKTPLDQMVRMGWLKDDGPQWVEFEKPVQRLGPKSITFRIAPVPQTERDVEGA